VGTSDPGRESSSARRNRVRRGNLEVVAGPHRRDSGAEPQGFPRSIGRSPPIAKR
jgi:hypothetical protein